MITRLVLGGWLLIVWLALWGDVSAANVLSGLVVAGGLLAAFPPGLHVPVHRVRPLALIVYVGFFVYKLVESSLIVAWEVVSPVSRINQGIVAVPVRSGDDILLTILGNSLSLTPGTLTVEVRREPPTLYVHVLHMRSIEQTRQEVQRLEELMLRAFAPDVLEQPRPDPAGAGGGDGRT